MPQNNLSLLLNISPFCQEQVKEASALHKLCFNEPWSELSLTTLLQNSYIYGFLAHTSEHGLMGLLLGQITPGEAEIYTLATHPDYRRQGVASQLIEKLIVECLAQSVERILLEVNETNFSAIEFYKEAGFTAYGRREKYYTSCLRHYSDAILFERRLK